LKIFKKRSGQLTTFFGFVLEVMSFRIESATHQSIFFMITTPNPYLQLFFDFLHSNPSAGFVYLSAYETDDYTVLYYDSDHKYSLNEEFMASLPYQRIYSQVAQQWWQLLDEQGLMQPAPAAQTQLATTGGAVKRRAKLECEAEHALYCYLEKQLLGACPPDVRCCQQLDELHSIASTFTETINNRIQQAVAGSMSEFDIPSAQQPVALLNVWPWGQIIGQHVDYKFTDGVVVSNVQESHRRPFQFAGIWVELPDSEKLELPVQLGFTDSRQQPVASLNEAQSRQLTTQWCLEQGYKQLVLGPQLRQVVEAYGVADAAQPARRWLSGGQLLVDLVQYHAQVRQRSAPQPMGESPKYESDLPWDNTGNLPLITDADYELPF
jgi:hypothetical protein